MSFCVFTASRRCRDLRPFPTRRSSALGIERTERAGRHRNEPDTVAGGKQRGARARGVEGVHRRAADDLPAARRRDRKSTRLNSSHLVISYAVFCLKKKKVS